MTERPRDSGFSFICYDAMQCFVGLLLIAIGFMNGMVRLVDSLSLEDCTAQPFNNTHREAITHIAFSHNCEYFATSVSSTRGINPGQESKVRVQPIILGR